jgi:hypothetical protein
MPAENPPTSGATKRTLVGQRVSRQQGRRDREEHSQHEQQLAPVAVADRTEPENRGGEAERVADRDQIQGRLRRVERLPDRREGDVRDGQVEVGDRRHEDERDEDEPRALRRNRRPGCDRLAQSTGSALAGRKADVSP